MANLSSTDLDVLWRDYMAACSAGRRVIAVNKANVKEAITAIDQWVEANQASFNAAIPQPARAAMSTKEKAAMLTDIVRRRYEVA